jgi:hypothetical protein
MFAILFKRPTLYGKHSTQKPPMKRVQVKETTHNA